MPVRYAQLYHYVYLYPTSEHSLVVYIVVSLSSSLCIVSLAEPGPLLIIIHPLSPPPNTCQIKVVALASSSSGVEVLVPGGSADYLYLLPGFDVEESRSSRVSRGHGLISPDVRPLTHTHNMFTRAAFISPPTGSSPVIFNRSTNKNHTFSHPEIELRPSVFGSLPRVSKGPTKTILDFLEVYPDHANWKERLGHSSLLKCFQVGTL